MLKSELLPKPPKRRSRPLRVESDGVLWFVTARVIEGRFVLHPILANGLQPPNHKARRVLQAMQRHCEKRLAGQVKRANAQLGPYQAPLTAEDAKRLSCGLVGSALARAQERFGVQVMSLTVMSNHIHLVVRTTRKNLAAFMGYFKARVAESINHLTGRRGPLWARRYDAQPILDDAGATGRVGYSLGNPRKAGLVDDFEQWPGLNLAYGIGDDDALNFEYLDRTGWHRARRPQSLSPFFKTATLKLSPLPSCEGMSREVYRDAVLSWVQDAQANANARREHGPRLQVAGIEKIVHADFDTRPKQPASRRRPYAFGEPEARAAHRQGMIELMQGYQRCSERYRNGERMVPFPEGVYLPPVLQAA
jgi:REP element-mobilizing transposase RayT